MKHLLQVKNLKIQFSSSPEPAVNGINFYLNRGEVLGIVGESGSGKSLTALSLMNLLPGAAKRLSGEIFLHTRNDYTALHDLDEIGWKSIRGNRIGMVFQEPATSLNPVLTCGYQVEEIAARHLAVNPETAKAIALKQFEKVGLQSPARVYRSYPHELSGGQRQRVMIAMALACLPDLLIADEPTTALDVVTQKGILELFKDLKKDGDLSILFISHDIAVVGEICDRVLVMKDGAIVEEGLTLQVLKQPRHPYTKLLIDSRTSFVQNSANQIAEPPNTLLKVENLSVKFRQKTNLLSLAKKYFNAVNYVSFEVKKGEILGIVGESGSGKTTLGRSILNLIEADSGLIFFENQVLHENQTTDQNWLHKKIQIIFQDPFSALNPRQTLGQALYEAMKFHGIITGKSDFDAAAAEVLQKVGLLPEYLARFPHQLSGGQRQRFAIAKAISIRPEVLICDECTASLDAVLQHQVLQLLSDLKSAFGLTYLFISHDLSLVRRFCDRVLILQNGKVVEIGSCAEVFDSPKKNYTRVLLDAIPKAVE